MLLTQHKPTSLRARLLLTAVATAALALLLALPAESAPTTAASGVARTSDYANGKSAKKTKKTIYPHLYTLTNAKIGHWAVVVRPAAVHAKPNASSHTITTLKTVTSDGTQNLVLILTGMDLSHSQTWYRVRLPILPNNSTGWVPRNALGNIYTVHTHLYVNRETQTATLKRNGTTIFTTRVGVGKSFWPTPAGQFYIRDKLTDFNNAAYGPVAFGTSARSPVLTDWPGGGFVGVHGTNEPQIIPGYISHGCIRLVNSAILRLAKLMQVGTPLTVT